MAFSIAFKIVSNLRMQVVSATFAGLPAARKRWYIDGGLDPAVFARWQPAPHDASAAAAPAPASRRAASASAEAKVQVGSRYVALPRVCDCLPWEDCDACRLQAWPK